MVEVATNDGHGTNRPESAIKALLDEGQSVWQDDISRAQLANGTLERAIEKIGIRGLTSNPTIFAKAITAGSDYDEQITRLLRAGEGANAIVEAVAVQDIRDACDLFRPLYDATDGEDGFCSIEVSPDAAHDAESTRTQVRRLWEAVDRPNLMVKIPGTAEGAPVVEEMLAEGRNINITLLFSIASYERVAEGYIAALEQRLQEGRPIDRIASVASFFVSRVDTAVDALIDEKIVQASSEAERHSLQGLKGTIAIANAKLAYEKFRAIFGGPRFQRLAGHGAKPQRPLWASTGTKNPAYRDVLYVETLVGPHTINTMPGKTLEAFLDHGVVARTVDQDLAGAHRIIQELAAVGIDLDAVTKQLEDEGNASFATSVATLLAAVEGKNVEPPSPRVRVRRVYEPPSPEDGRRILVDRVWPRGLTREAAHADVWLRDVAPSDDLRHWFGHDPARWEEFRRRYREELTIRPGAIEFLLAAARQSDITLVYSARDERHNQAVALQGILAEQLSRA